MKLTASFLLSLVTSVLLSAAFMALLPGNPAIRFGWSSLLFTLLWPGLFFACYWPESTWRPMAVLGVVTTLSAGAIWFS